MDARIEAPTDVVVRITTTNICGSDLHMYDGWTKVLLHPGQAGLTDTATPASAAEPVRLGPAAVPIERSTTCLRRPGTGPTCTR